MSKTSPLMGLFSWITLAAHLLQQNRAMTHRMATWYAKPVSTFVGPIAMVRRHLWTALPTFLMSAPDPDVEKVPDNLYARLIDSLAYAA